MTSAAVCALLDVLRSRGWWSADFAESADVVLDTYHGLAAMVWPGNDAYSKAQEGDCVTKPVTKFHVTGRRIYKG